MNLLQPNVLQRKIDHITERIKAFLGSYFARVNEDPIFIFGNQKSGTSAITALLGKATGNSYTIDVLFRYRGLEEKLLSGESTFKDVIDIGRYYFAKNIIKDPSFILFLEDINTIFPNSRKVFVLRNPWQNIRSILNRLNIPGDLEDLSFQQWEELKRRLPNWYLVLNGELSGHQGRTYIETLARRWVKIYSVYKENKSTFTLVKYEDFNTSKVDSIRVLAENLGLEVIYDIELFKDYQFQRKGSNDVSIQSFFGSRNYEIISVLCNDIILEI